MKGLLKWIGILLGVLVILVVAASIVIMVVVNKDMIARQMESFLHRHVTIGEIHVGLFSVVSGVEVDGVRISHYKTPGELEALRGKPVPDDDLFAGLKQLRLALKILPLLSGSIQVGEFVLYEPVVHIVKHRDGTYNFSDLLTPPAGEKEAPEKGPTGPFSADDLPVSLLIGKVGVEGGTVTYLDERLKQTLELYGLTLLVHSVEIDPGRLAEKDTVKVRFETGVKPRGRLRTGGVKFFDIGLDAKGSVKPFDVETRLLDPEVALKVGSSHGTLSGVRILEALQSVQALQQYTGKLSFLGDEVSWKDASMDLWYKADTVKISTGRILGDDYTLEFAGAMNLRSKGIDLDLAVELGEKPTEALRASIAKKLQRQIQGEAARYVSGEQLADIVMKHLTNERGNVYLKYKVKGTATSPRPTLVQPTVPTLKSLLKEAGADVKGIAEEAAKKEAQKLLKDATKGLDKDLKKRFRF